MLPLGILPCGTGGRVNTGDIPASLRGRASATPYLSRTASTPTNDKKCLVSLFIRRSELSASAGTDVVIGTTGDYPGLIIWGTGIVASTYENRLMYRAGGTNKDYWLPYFRDVTGFSHLIVSFDTTQATQADRAKAWLNGVEMPKGASALSLNEAVVFNVAATALRMFSGAGNGGGYRARIAFLDGKCIQDGSAAVSDFIELNPTINEWVSKTKAEIRAAVLAGGGARNGWGANGFMEDFEDATSLTTLGYDTSQADDGTGGNHWTLNNFSLTAGTTYDHMLDVPGNSFAVLNSLDTFQTPTVKDGNLDITQSAAQYGKVRGSLWFDAASSEGYYFELHADSVTVNDSVGVADTTAFSTNAVGNTGVRGVTARGAGGGNTWWTLLNEATYSSDTGITRAQGQVISIAVRNGKLYAAINGTWVLSGNPVTEANPLFSGLTGMVAPYVSVYQSAVTRANFGQRPFVHTPPTGFKVLCQANLETPAILNPTDHHIDITVTKSGDTNFTLPWDADTYDTLFEIKRRNSTGDWYQIDGLRGYDKILKSNSIAAETTDANVLGVSGTTCTLKSTLADGTYIVSATKAGLSASRQTNTDGSITSTVSRNVDSGFSIVIYTGTGANATVGHGQGKVVKTLIVKQRNGSTYSWTVQHANVAVGSVLALEATYAAFSRPTAFNSTYPTSSVFSLGTDLGTNANTNTYVAYCYADSAIQKSFSYTSNGSTDGPNPNLGFKCGRTLLKSAAYAQNWVVNDSARSPSNVAANALLANSPNAESTSSAYYTDLNSNSLKIRTTDSELNYSVASTYIGHAWAAVTGKYSLGR